MQKYYDQFETCREHEIPFCADACPFKFNFLDIQDKFQSGRYNVAYKALRDATVFPEIVASLCPGYCEKACIRSSLDEPVHISLLEKTILAKATRKNPNEYNLPAKKGKIAVVGGGISGLGFTFRLASKKYDVTLYEKSSRIGGRLWDYHNASLFMADIENQFKYEEYTLKLNSEVKDIYELVSMDYDIIYVATGEKGQTFQIDKCACIENTAIFIGGGKEAILSLADGINISRSAEIYLKTKTLKYPESSHSLVVANEDKLKEMKGITPTADNGLYTDEEASYEASRCIKCQCDSCRTYCDIVDYFDKWPIAMRDEILLTCKPSHSTIHKNPAMRLINTCTQCGLCKEICPEGIDLADMIHSARRKLHSLNKTPGAFRQYWLNDMEFANGSFSSLNKLPADADCCDYAFFPGCQLGALNPEYILKPYRWLLSKHENTGLLLRCCGIPVDWNGEESRHNDELEKIREEWSFLGKPKLITACISCEKHLNEYLPEIETVSLYEILSLWGFKPDSIGDYEDVYSVFDPCSARNNDAVQSAVRDLASSAGLQIQELPKGDKHGCCGYGGLVSVATPGFSDYVAQKRSTLSDNPYIVYCSNCRDVFSDYGKPVSHILDLLFDIETDTPTVTERRKNRVLLKESLLKEFWNEIMENKPEKCRYCFSMTDEIKEKINKQRLLEDDLCSVVEFAEKTGRKTLNKETGAYKAYKEIGNITCWVEYHIDGDTVRIVNVYSHRMKIELEAVFNGRKIDMQ